MGLRTLPNLDANMGVFFERQLEHIKAETYDVEYPELMARKLIPVSFEAGPGATSITYRQFDRVGVMALISDYANALPRVDVLGKEFTSPVKSIGGAYGYNLQEIRSAQMAGVPLDSRKAEAARAAFEQTVDEVGTKGNAETGIKGFLNHPNVPRGDVAQGATGADATAKRLWANKTPAEIVKDINAAVAAIRSATNSVESGPFTVLLPDDQYTLIASTKNSDSSDVTILEFVLKANPFIKEIVPWYQLKGAGSGGTDRMLVYIRDPRKLTLEIPQDFEQLDVQPKGLEFEVPCHGRIGGVIFYRPFSARYVDGI